MKRLLLFAILALPVSAQNNYYVSTTGSDSNNGSQSAPWKTVSHASSALSLGTEGTIVHVAAGTYNGCVTTGRGGTSGQPITYVSDTKWGAKIVGDSSCAIGFTWELNGSGATWVTVKDFDIGGAGCGGLSLRASNDTAIGNNVHNSATGCDVTINVGNGGSGINATATASVNDKILNNFVHDVGMVNSYCQDRTNSGIQGIYDSTGGPTTIANNLIVNNCDCGVQMWHGASNATIVNNTIVASRVGIVVGSGDSPCSTGGTCLNDNTIVFNNIIVNDSNSGLITEASNGGHIGTHNQFAFNLFFGNPSGRDWAGLTCSPGCVVANPLFVNGTNTASGDYHLQSSSPAIGSGTTTDAPTTDFDGIGRSAPITIGAYQGFGHVVPAGPQWSVGYWLGADSVPISSIQMNALTHIVFTSAQVQTNGSLVYKCSFGPCTESQLGTEAIALLNLAHPKGVKVLLGLDNVSGTQWSGCAGTNRSTCVTNIMQLVNAYGYDGVDIDWEQSINFTQLGSLITALRTALGTKLLSMVANPAPSPVPANYASVAAPLDRVNVSVTDQGGNFNPYTWFNNPLFSDSNNSEWSVDLAKQRFVAAGIPANKMNFGISLYGEVQTGAIGPRLADTVSAISQISYRDILSTYPSFVGSPTIDSVAKVPWFSPDASHWVTYNNPASVTSFVNYAKANSTGGWFLYSLEHDYIASATPTHPLMNAVALAMGTFTSVPTISAYSKTPSTPVTPGTSVTLAWTSSGGLSATINGAAVALSGSEVVNPLTTTSYNLIVSNSAGPVSALQTVSVGALPVISSFTASPSTIALGGSSTLALASTGGTSCSIDQGVGTVACNSSTPVSPLTSKLYIATVTNSFGSKTAQVLVGVSISALVGASVVNGQVVIH